MTLQNVTVFLSIVVLTSCIQAKKDFDQNAVAKKPTTPVVGGQGAKAGSGDQTFNPPVTPVTPALPTTTPTTTVSSAATSDSTDKINAGGATTTTTLPTTTTTTDDKIGGSVTPATGGTTGTTTSSTTSAGAGGRPNYKKPITGYTDAKITDWASKANCTGVIKCIHVPTQAVASQDLLDLIRVGIFKAINHVCFGPKDLVIGEDVSEGYGLVFKVDMSKCWGANAEVHWAKAVNAQKKGIGISPAVSPLNPITSVGNSVPGDQLAYNLLHGEIYNNIMGYPGQEQSFNQVFQTSPAILFSSAVKDAIVCGPRLITGHKYTFNGAQYWYVKSHDEFDGRAGGDISDQYKANAPTVADYRDGSGSSSMTLSSKVPGQESVASEWWLEMPNGFLAFGIHGEGTQERTRAEFPFAVDPYTPSGCLETGRCINCHSAGVRGVPSTPASTSGNGWTKPDDLNKVYNDIRGRYQASMRAIIERMSDASKSLEDEIINGTKEPALFAERMYEERAGISTGGFECGTCASFCGGKFQKAGLCDLGQNAGRARSLGGSAATGAATGAGAGAGAGAGSSGGGALGGFLGGN